MRAARVEIAVEYYSAVKYFCSNGCHVVYLPSLKSLLFQTAFLGDKLTYVFRSFVAHNLRWPLRITAEMVCNIGPDDPRHIFIQKRHNCDASLLT